jgi:hypothetical protein
MFFKPVSTPNPPRGAKVEVVLEVPPGGFRGELEWYLSSSAINYNYIKLSF